MTNTNTPTTLPSDGTLVMRLGPMPADRAGYMGAKIAFARIPDEAEFSE